MAGSFRTSADQSSPLLRPFAVAVGRDDVFREVVDMVADLPGWAQVSADAETRTVVAEKQGLLSGTSRITITVEGPEGIPSATVNLASETSGGLLARDKAHVAEFMTPFQRRVG